MNVDDIQTFSGDLRAAIKAGVKLEIGEKPVPGSTLSLKQIERLERQITDASEVPPRYQAAIETWQKTGTMIPVLEGLSTRFNAWVRIDRMFRKSMVYVSVLAALGIVGLIYFRTSVLPQIEMMRHDLATLARPAIEIRPSGVELFSIIVLILFVVILVVLIYGLFSGGAAKLGCWLGGDRYMRCCSQATATRTMQMLVAEGTDPHQAAMLGGKLAGLDAEGQGEMIYNIKGLDREAILSPAWVDYLSMMADRQYLKSRTWGPATLVLIVGGIMTFLYVLLAYWPIVSLVYDLSGNRRIEL
jgi:hypothetical protein